MHFVASDAFRGESSWGIARCRLFSQANSSHPGNTCRDCLLSIDIRKIEGAQGKMKMLGSEKATWVVCQNFILICFVHISAFFELQKSVKHEGLFNLIE